MRAIQFIKWWWKEREAGEKILAFVFGWLFVSLLTVPFVGVHAVGVYLAGLVLGAFIFAGTTAAKAGWESWKEFSRTHPTSQELVVRKLRGD